MTRILVTGANGFAGRYVVDALCRRGLHVTGVYRREPGQRPDVAWHRADITDIGSVRPLLLGQDAVIHLAAELSRANLMDTTNVAATAALFDAAQRAGIRYFGHASSVVVYGSPSVRLVDESTPRLNPMLAMAPQYRAEPYMLDYARTKVLGEQALEAAARNTLVDLYRPAVVIERKNILHAGDWGRAKKALAAKRRTQYVLAEDVAEAICHLMMSALDERASRRVVESYNLSDPDCGTFAELFDKAMRATGDPRFKVPIALPPQFDMIKDMLRHRTLALRYPLGALDISSAKLFETGFRLPTGMPAAILDAIAAA